MRRAIGKTYGASRIVAFVRVDFDLVREFQRHVAGVDVERAAREIAQPALSALFVINPAFRCSAKGNSLRRPAKPCKTRACASHVSVSQIPRMKYGCDLQREIDRWRGSSVLFGTIDPAN